MLEVGGVDVLSVSVEDWTNIQRSLTFPVPVVSVRREERAQTSPNVSLR